MSSSNNNKKNDDTGGGKKKAPNDLYSGGSNEATLQEGTHSKALINAHRFAEEAKEEEMEATALEDSVAMLLQEARKENYVGSSKEIPFAEEAKVEERDQEANTTWQEIHAVVPQFDNDSSDIFVPAVLSRAVSPRDVVTESSLLQGRPGAFSVRGPAVIPRDDFFLHVATALATNEVQDEHEQLEPATLFNAVLVDDPEIANASIIDHEAEGKAQCRRQLRNTLVIILVIGILLAIIAIPIQLTKPEPLLKTLAPSESPSASPSQSLFLFLAEKSRDNGTALSTTGSSQQKALTWLEQSPLYNSVRDYTLSQFFALAVFNYATGDLLSNQSWLQDNGTVSKYDFCKWDYIRCNDGNDITFLYPDSSQIDPFRQRLESWQVSLL